MFTAVRCSQPFMQYARRGVGCVATRTHGIVRTRPCGINRHLFRRCWCSEAGDERDAPTVGCSVLRPTTVCKDGSWSWDLGRDVVVECE